MFALARKTPDDWDQTLTKMVSNGLVVTDEEYDAIMTYLTTNLAPLPPKINVNKATADELQKGLGLTDAEAQAIVKFHADHGDFKTWNDVAKVDGVDPKKIEVKKDAIAF
jgi:competence protein ComEA